MGFELIVLREDISSESNKLERIVLRYLNKKFICPVLFNPQTNLVLNATVFYSEKKKFWYSKFRNRENIVHVFGLFNKEDFAKARMNVDSLKPLFVFEFNYNYTPKNYEAVFVKKNNKYHLMSKVYELSEEIRDFLMEKELLFELKDKEYYLFDFGKYYNIHSFLNNLKNVLSFLSFTINSNKKLTIDFKNNHFLFKSEYTYCMLCGNKLSQTIPKYLKEFSNKFEAKCNDCLEQIYVLDLYFKLKNRFGDISFEEGDIKDLFEDEDKANYSIGLLFKYDLVKPFLSDFYKLNANKTLERDFELFLHPPKEEKIQEIPEMEKLKCKICGNTFEEVIETDYCEECSNKINVAKDLIELLEYIKPNKGFSKEILINEGFNSLTLNLIFNDLLDYELIRPIDENNLFILADVSIVNNFLEEYSLNQEFTPLSNEPLYDEKIEVYSYQLSSEKLLDEAVNLFIFSDYVDIRFIKNLNFWRVQLKKENRVITKKLFVDTFDAKLYALDYLIKLNLIYVLSDDVLYDKKGVKICPACLNEFKPVTKKQKFCDNCKSKYNQFEREVLTGINEGIYTKELADKIVELKKYGKSNVGIAKELGLKNTLIPHILKFTNVSIDSTNVDKSNSKKSYISKTCAICGASFEISKNIQHTKKYCDNCKSKYTYNERIVLTKINEGEITSKTAEKIIYLKNQGYSNKIIAKKLFLRTAYIQSILDYFGKDNNIEGISKDISKEDTEKSNVELDNRHEFKSLFVSEQLNYTEIILKGIITEKDRKELFKSFSFSNDSRIEEMFCKSQNNLFEVNIKLLLTKIDEVYHLNIFKSLGWKEK